MYTDGAWDGEEQQKNGGDGQQGPPPPAGWGIAEITMDGADGQVNVGQVCIPIGQLTTGDDPSGTGRLTYVDSERVAIDEQDQDNYIDAPGMTNNTGELTALYWALRRARARKPGVGREVIHSDSLYAINMATGKWMPKVKRNAPMIGRIRTLWYKLQAARPGEVALRHVRSHIKVPGNEIADWLAGRGASIGRTTLAQAERWIARWLQQQRNSLGESSARPPGSGEVGSDPPG